MQKASENEVFITLVSAAKEDNSLARRILTITKLPELERKIKVLELVGECRKEEAPEDFIGALTFLGEESIARKLCEFLDI